MPVGASFFLGLITAATALGCAPAPTFIEPTVVTISSSPSHQTDSHPLPAVLSIPKASRAELTWQLDEAEARERARREGRPLLIYLRADWAAASLWMEREVWSDPRVAVQMRAVVPLKVDLTQAEGNAELLAQHYGIDTVPTVKIYNPEGRNVATLAGSQGAETLLAAMRTAIE